MPKNMHVVELLATSERVEWRSTLVGDDVDDEITQVSLALEGGGTRLLIEIDGKLTVVGIPPEAYEILSGMFGKQTWPHQCAEIIAERVFAAVESALDRAQDTKPANVPPPKPALFVSPKLATDRRTLKDLLKNELLNGRTLHTVVLEDDDFTRLFGTETAECEQDKGTMGRFGVKLLLCRSAHESKEVGIKPPVISVVNTTMPGV